MAEMDMKEKLVDIVEYYADFLNWDTKEEMVDSIMEFIATDNNVGSKWISVKDRLPESGKDAVLIALRWGEVDIGWCEEGLWGSEFVNEYDDGEVTHWTPLPQPPKGE